MRRPILQLRRFLAALLAGMLLVPAATRAQANPQEYQLKAVFLFRFAQFAEWPEDTFMNDGTPLVIGVLGKDPFGTLLDDAVRNETVGTHPLSVRRFAK